MLTLAPGQDDLVTTRTLLPALAAAALLAGCGGSSSPVAAKADSSPSALASAAASSAASAPAPGGSAAAGTSGAAPAAAGTTTTGGSSTGTGTTGAATTNGGASSAFTAPGTYTYDNSGTVTAGSSRDASGTATLTVDPPSGGQQHSLLGNDQGRTEQTVVVRPDGTYLVRLVITNPAFSKDFRPAKPVLLAPDPAKQGQSWSWKATSTDGKTTVSVTATMGGQETLTIGGAKVTTTIIDSTLRITGDVNYTAQMRTWHDPADRLIAKEHTKGSGSFNNVPFTTDITSTLRSTKPS
jgi:hypothetical protein